MASEAEVAAMRHAIMLSGLGLGTTSPNPPVGCAVLDRSGRVAGTGFHRRKGGPHAEVHALRSAGPAARGGTAVVTLEPCNHVGVTPACHQALLDAGIERVVIGMIDPTSRGDGGAAVLVKAGIDVEVGVLDDEVMTVLRPWLVATVRRRVYTTWVRRAGTAVGRGWPDGVLAWRSGVDLLLANDSVEEGSPGGHSDDHFKIADVPLPAGDAEAWLSAAFRAGARSVLLLGDGDAARSLEKIDAIDEVVVVVPRSQPPVAFAPALGQSAEFPIVGTGYCGDDLLVRLRRPDQQLLGNG